MISLEDVKTDSWRYGPFAYIATNGTDGEPHLARSP
jgi:hypothetical protein